MGTHQRKDKGNEAWFASLSTVEGATLIRATSPRWSGSARKTPPRVSGRINLTRSDIRVNPRLVRGLGRQGRVGRRERTTNDTTCESIWPDAAEV